MATGPRSADAHVNTGTVDCGRHARFDSEAQADYVAADLGLEWGTVWVTVPHGEHFHVIDTGQNGRSEQPR